MYDTSTKFEPHSTKNFYELKPFEITQCADYYLNEALQCDSTEMLIDSLCKVRLIYSWYRLAENSARDYTFDVLFTFIGHPSNDGIDTGYCPADLATIMYYDHALLAYVYSLALGLNDMAGSKLTVKQQQFLKDALYVYEHP
jgi:hypothetical protein